MLSSYIHIFTFINLFVFSNLSNWWKFNFSKTHLLFFTFWSNFLPAKSSCRFVHTHSFIHTQTHLHTHICTHTHLYECMLIYWSTSLYLWSYSCSDTSSGRNVFLIESLPLSAWIYYSPSSQDNRVTAWRPRRLHTWNNTTQNIRSACL